ncbi:histidinol-phosphate transaminase [Microbacterium sp. SSW1-49]|uniref:Histidinol-phosphate transaminase n=1 Tax=Microbacterium croceum TaxID=2851645 RepID=A0ABT0FEQ0_9MICO|nr:histidinol-phosphate transaminase [Microbacterium croceum]MCK2036545.1 histidinol-phosphate transaminase [Microbacterium croceum]
MPGIDDVHVDDVQPLPGITRLPRYRPGKPAVGRPGLTAFKLSSNESPFDPLPAVVAAMRQADRLNIYPDPTALPLRESLADLLGVRPSNIVAGTGSLAVLNDVLQVFAGRRADGTTDEVVYAWRSFESYPISVGQVGALGVPVALRPDGTHDLEGMLAAVTERTRVLILCTPNNPTGPALRHSAVRDFLVRVPSHVLVVIDEAYVEYVRGEDRIDAMALHREFTNVLVLRTFSKAHGLAGLRVGYCVAQEHVIQYLETVAVPFSVPHPAQMAAIASLQVLPAVLERVEQTVQEREWFRMELLGSGLRIPDAQGNFVWLPWGELSAEFTALCNAQAVAVRQFGAEGVRVSIGVREAHERVLEVARDIALPSVKE